MALTEQQTLEIKTALKRCRPETIDAALRFRDTRDAQEVPTIVYGIIERHLAPEAAQRLEGAADTTRLVEDLGIDSLTMLEVVLAVEETLHIGTIENEHLKEIRTLGEIKAFIAQRVSGGGEDHAAGRPKLRRYDREAIISTLPQQPPFLFLDEAEIEESTVRARYTVRGDEHFLEGHFKGNPVFPASIVFEALGQAACLWVLENQDTRNGQFHSTENATGLAEEVLFASMESAHFYRRAKPGDVLELEAKLQKMREPLAIFDGTVQVAGQRLAQIEHLVLAFGPQVTEHMQRVEAGSGESPSFAREGVILAGEAKSHASDPQPVGVGSGESLR